MSETNDTFSHLTYKTIESIVRRYRMSHNLSNQLRERGICVLKELNGPGVTELCVGAENSRVQHGELVGYERSLLLRIEGDHISIHLPVIGGTGLEPLWSGRDLERALDGIELAFSDAGNCWLQNHTVYQKHACLRQLLDTVA